MKAVPTTRNITTRTGQFGANATVAHFEELFFSTGQVATGSVREYYTEATNGLVTIAGQVVGLKNNGARVPG